MMAPGGARNSDQGNLRGDITPVHDKEKREGHAVEDGS